jgi:tartrate dehydrogenase/decarboxylase/D-malate dehydrogenase
MSHTFRVAVIAGDGIGKEVIPAGVAAIEKATSGSDLSMSFTDLPWSCDYYLRHQRMMDEDGFDRLSTYDAIYLGALGAPGVSDVVSAGLGSWRSGSASISM